MQELSPPMFYTLLRIIVHYSNQSFHYDDFQYSQTLDALHRRGCLKKPSEYRFKLTKKGRESYKRACCKSSIFRENAKKPQFRNLRR